MSGPSDPEDAGDQEPVGPSLWAQKPWWCQPWTILLTGIALVLASWLLLQRWWISLPVAVLVLAWWGLFLVLVPLAWNRQQAQRRSPPEEG